MTEKIKVEIACDFKHDGNNYSAEEIRMVTAAVAEYFCGNGWAKAVNGEFETGVISTQPKRLAPEKVEQVIGVSNG